ncbi:MAG: SHOCT domain-containing protein [Geodermatophilaceae bacterium]|nr:SHOCT domain-containing protein [Geodermatophilaceae bacterium]
MTGTAAEDSGVGAALDVLGRLDPAAYAEVLEHRAEAAAVIDLLGDDEEVTWLHVARMWQGGSSGGLAGVLVVTDQRLLFLPPPRSGFPPGLWTLDHLSAVSQSGPRLDVEIAGVRLVLLVRNSALAEATAGVLAEYLTGPEPAAASSPPRVVDELTNWANLWQRGAISTAEFEQRKAELLRRPEWPA